MPKLQLTTTAKVTTKLKLSPKVLVMLKARCEEYTKLLVEEKKIKARKKAIGAGCVTDAKGNMTSGEVYALMEKEDALDALYDGCEIDGIPISLVEGESSSLDKDALKKYILRLGGDPSKIESEFTTKKPKAAYVKIGKGED